METDMIKITHLKKSFGDVKAVNDLSFQVKKGELFAFLGVNGAGKSTTISIICGQLRISFLSAFPVFSSIHLPALLLLYRNLFSDRFSNLFFHAWTVPQLCCFYSCFFAAVFTIRCF